MKVTEGHVSILERPILNNREPYVKHMSWLPLPKFNEGRDIISMGRPNSGSRDQLIFSARIFKKYIGCGKWKTEDSFTLSHRDLICNKCEHECKRRGEIRRRRTGRRTIASATNQISAWVIPQRAKSFSAQPGKDVGPRQKSTYCWNVTNAEFLLPKNGVYSQELIYFVLPALQ